MHQSDTIMYLGGFKALIGFDRSITPAATSTAVCAWAIDGLTPQKMQSKPGVVQRYFTGKDRTCYVVFNDGGVPRQLSFKLDAIPRDWQIVDVMGNDPRLDGHTSLSIGITPIFVIAPADKGMELVRTCQKSLVPVSNSDKK